MSDFRPYQTWLGLQQEAPNHYELLNIALGESDSNVISAAAANVRRRICGVKPQPDQVQAWSDLLSRLEEAETVLTNSTTRAAYDQQLGIHREEEIPMATPVSSPPPPAPQSTSAPQQSPSSGYYHTPPSTPYSQPGYPPQPGYADQPGYTPQNAPPGYPQTPQAAPQHHQGAPPPPQPSLPDPMAPVGQTSAAVGIKSPSPVGPETPKLGPSPSGGRRIRRRKRSNNLPMVLGICAFGALLVAGGLMVLNNMDKPTPKGKRGTRVASGNGNAPSTPSPKAPPRTKRGPTDVAVASPKSRTQEPPSAVTPLPEGNVEDSMPADTGKAPATGPQTMPNPPTTPEPKPEPTTPPEPSPPQPATPPEPEPTTPATPEPTSEQVAALNKLMQTARDHLSEANLEEAERVLSEAAALPASSHQKEQLDRLTAAVGLVGQFHDGLNRSLSELKGLDEIDIGPVKAVIVEIRPDEIVLRASGQNRTYPRNQLPALVGLTLADRVMPSNVPENQVVKAMYLAVHHQRTASVLEKSKEMLESAIAAGANASMLVPFVEDSYTADGAPSKVTPLPEMPAPEPTTPPTPQQVEAMTALLAKIEGDFGKNNVIAAKKRLEGAATAPATPAQRESVARLAKAAARLEAFHAALNTATDELKPDDEIKVTDTISAKVIQVTNDKLRIELTGGTMRTLDRKELPPALAVEIARRKLADDAPSKVMTALFVVFHPTSTGKYKEQAKGWVEESGQDADLLPLFESL